MKHYISVTASDTQWLLEELPGPPVERLLGDYIPTLPTLSGTPADPLPTDVRERLRRAQHVRNKVAHAGREHVDSRFLENTLETVREILRKLDSYRGFSWALAPYEP